MSSPRLNGRAGVRSPVRARFRFGLGTARIGGSFHGALARWIHAAIRAREHARSSVNRRGKQTGANSVRSSREKSRDYPAVTETRRKTNVEGGTRSKKSQDRKSRGSARFAITCTRDQRERLLLIRARRRFPSNSPKQRRIPSQRVLGYGVPRARNDYYRAEVFSSKLNCTVCFELRGEQPGVA